MGFRSRLVGLGKSAAEREADKIRHRALSLSPMSTEPLVDRRPASVAGVVRSVALPQQEELPMLVAELFDGHTSIDLVWVGRRRIAGIEPGVALRADGRVCHRHGVPTIFNPDYTLVA